MMYEWLVAGSVPACALSIQIDAQLQMTDQMRAVLEKKQKESEEQIKARELAERERARKFRELTYICIDILNMIQGKFVTEEEVISNIETMKTHKEVNEVHISFAERADAALGLWQFQFKVGLYKEVVAAAGGAHLCASILDRPPRVPLAEREAGARLLRNCLVVLKALSSHRPCVDYLMEAKVASSAISLSPLLQASPCLAVTVVSERAFPLSLFLGSAAARRLGPRRPHGCRRSHHSDRGPRRHRQGQQEGASRVGRRPPDHSPAPRQQAPPRRSPPPRLQAWARYSRVFSLHLQR